MFVFFVNTPLQNTMVEQNVPNQPPTRTDEQIVPRSQWLTIGKSNLLFNAQKIQKNPIFQISVNILSNTNFFQAFTALANVPAIYLQQFWNRMKYNEKTGKEDEAQQESIPQREDDDPDLELAKKLSLETPQEKGEGEGDDADLERAIKLSLDPAFLPQGRAGHQGGDTEKAHEALGLVQTLSQMIEDQTGTDSGKFHVISCTYGPNPEHMMMNSLPQPTQFGS
ncbi:hypothetical protein Tco_0425030 [Tanacetum coccineum]